MTVCIAAICDDKGDEAIIHASDRMISMGGILSGDDIARKIDPINYGWDCMIAGNDISPVTPILQRIHEVNRDIRPLTLKSVSDAVKNAYRDQRLEQIEDEILSTMGMSWQSFRASARDELSPQAFERLTDRIRSYELQVELLVSGFDHDGGRHIFTVQNPGKCDYYDKVGFWAIGSGQHQAISSLFWNKYNRFNELPLCVAHVLAAKLMAESAVGVGKETWLMVIKKATPGKTMFVDRKIHTEFRTKLQSLPKIPADMVPLIADNLAKEAKKIEDETAEEMKLNLTNLAKFLSTPQKSEA